MNLTGFVDVSIDDEDSMLEFLDLNALAHETIFTALLSTGVITDHYPIWTDGKIDRDWLLVHAAEHRAWSQALNLSNPPDIDEVDPEDQGQMSDWLQTHALHHQIVNEALGLT